MSSPEPLDEETSEGEESSVISGRRPPLLLLALLTLAGIVACDFVARIYLASRQHRLEAELATHYPPGTYVTSFAAKQDYRFINLYTMNPASVASPEYHFDERGFRLDRRRLRFGQADGHKRVWMLGGSTTQGLGLREDDTIAARLNDGLEAAGSDWRVLNLGQGGHTTTQELLLLTELLELGERPDAILCYDGINEMPFMADAAEAGFPDWQRRGPKPNVMLDIQGDDSVASLSVLTLTRWTKLDDFMTKASARLAGRAGTPPTSDSSDRGGTSHPGRNWDVVARRYLVNLMLIRAAAEAIKVPSLFYFQPVMQYEDHYKIRRYSSDEDELVAQMANNEFARREAVFEPALTPLRSELGTAFHDLHDAFRGHDGETLYADPRHPNGAGVRIVADRILVELREALARKASPP